MKKQKLQFKVDGGLTKVAELYTHAKNNKQAIADYWANPKLLLKSLTITSTSDIQLSSGYKKLADKMHTIDFNKWNDTFESTVEKNCFAAQVKPLHSLWNTVNGNYHSAAKAFSQTHASNVDDIVVTVTVTSGDPSPLKNSSATHITNAHLTQMTRVAQTVAEQIGWYS